jgi:MFS family permease
MYQVQNSQALLKTHRRLLAGGRARAFVSRTVLLLGLTSLFTDISSEMVATVLPLYLIYTIGLTPLQFGVADGLYQGGAALVRVASGFVGDRLRRHKEVAVVGYGLSAVCKLGFLAVGGALGALSAIILLDRTGKGIRTAPRDALISLSTPREQLGTAFGVHRALDTTGAMIGPLLGFVLLAVAPGRFDAVFVVSFCIALVGLGILTLFVENPPAPAAAPAPEEPKVSLRAACALLGGSRFRMLVLVGCGLGLATMSDAFVYLGLQRRLEFETRFLPLLYLGTALVYMTLAVPFGRLADRFGRARVFVGGHALLLLVYGVLLLPGIGPLAVVGCLALFGAYYAATDGVLMALGSSLLPEGLRGSGLALLATGTSLARLCGSITFGALWTFGGLSTAITVFAAALAVSTAAAALVATRAERTADA